MDLTPYVDHLRHELAVAVEAGGDDVGDVVERLTAPLESATRLTFLNALSAAMAEVTRDLAPGSVDVRLRGLDPEFVVTAPPAHEIRRDSHQHEPGARTGLPLAPADAEDGGTARINFRLPAQLKNRTEDAAGQEGLSVNAWLVRAVALALEGQESGRPAGPDRHLGRQDCTSRVH
ncbi:hypothetical protein [Streptomyces sp. NBC_00306]|uniref:hypothetical protein n=1 Tax=Streptomyces sp. NBC_00306 TaxID=2975708 RepID=UPI002E29790A|nr:hypothetical protein [Streptomyces sp. NBC_00306]